MRQRDKRIAGLIQQVEDLRSLVAELAKMPCRDRQYDGCGTYKNCGLCPPCRARKVTT